MFREFGFIKKNVIYHAKTKFNIKCVLECFGTELKNSWHFECFLHKANDSSFIFYHSDTE